MISEAHAAIASVAGDIGFKELMQFANLILFPVAAFIWRMDSKITKALEWMGAHDKLDDIRFKAFEQRHNTIDAALQAVSEGRPVSSAGMRESNG